MRPTGIYVFDEIFVSGENVWYENCFKRRYFIFPSPPIILELLKQFVGWLQSLIIKHHLFRAFFFFCWKVKPFPNLNMPFFKFSSDVKNFSFFFRRKNKLQLLAMKFSDYHELRKQIMQITKAKYLATSLCIGMVQQFNLTVEHRSLRWNSFLQSCL